MRIGEVGSDGECAFATRKRFVAAAEGAQRPAAIEPDLGKVRLECRGLVIARDRLLVAVEPLQQDPAIAPGDGQIRVEGKGALVARESPPTRGPSWRSVSALPTRASASPGSHAIARAKLASASSKRAISRNAMPSVL